MDPLSKEQVDPDLIRVAGDLWPYLIDDGVVEISLNDDGRLFVERFGAQPTYACDIAAHDAERFIRFCANMGNVAHSADQTIVSTRIHTTRHRLEGILPPNVQQASFSIRRHRDVVSDLSVFVPNADDLAMIKAAIMARKNILVSGGTGAGKTSFVDACLAYLAQEAPEQRCVILEDTAELQVPMPNALRLLSSHKVSLDQLLVSTLRLAPKRIFLGEVRSGRVMTLLLKAWNTGHPGGITTIHANSALDVIPRAQGLIAEELPNGADLLIAASLDLIIHLSRGVSAPQVTELAQVALEHSTLVIKEINHAK